MSDTTHLQLPFLQAAQAQKHVTVNDALLKLDALVHLSVLDDTLTTPPANPAEGERWLVAPSATDVWAGQEGKVAGFIDGAWGFFTPRAGWSVWVTSSGTHRHNDGTRWREGPRATTLCESENAARLVAHTMEWDHTITSGAFNDTGLIIPDRAIVLGVTGRVLTDVTGPTSWQLGVGGSADRYGNMIGTPAGSTVNGVSGSPTAYYGATPVRVTGTDANLVSGSIRLALHYFLLDIPSA